MNRHIQDLEQHLKKITTQKSSRQPKKLVSGWTKVSAVGYEFSKEGLTAKIVPAQTFVNIISVDTKDGYIVCLCQAQSVKVILPFEAIIPC